MAAAVDAPTPAVAMTVIQPKQDSLILALQSVWEYRELAYFLAWKEIKVRYKQTVLGVAWAVLQPFMTMLIFTVIFAYVARIQTSGIAYPLFAFSALLPWSYFAQGLTRGGAGLVNNANLISKVYFPRLIIPLVAATTPLFDFACAMVFLFGMLAWYQTLPPLQVLLLPLFIVMAFAAALSVGLWLSALNVRYRDVSHVIPFLVQFGVLASPVAYPASLVPQQWQLIYAFNPMVAVIEGFRWCLLDTPRPSSAMIVLGLATIALLFFTGLRYFKATERTFADII
jgi:lipopolysaccharide transport system permease protein